MVAVAWGLNKQHPHSTSSPCAGQSGLHHGGNESLLLAARAEEMFRRIDRLAALGTVTIRGEPLMHPALDEITGEVSMNYQRLITNGYRSPERIERPNRAGLEYLQISIDNVRPTRFRREPKVSIKLEFSLSTPSRIITRYGRRIGTLEDAVVISRARSNLASRRSGSFPHGGTVAP
jgi:hypothetical protein